MKRLLHFPVLLLLLLLGGCLEDESECHYAILAERSLYKSAWRFDSLRVIVRDTNNSIVYDTAYYHLGAYRFLPVKPYACNGSGTLCPVQPTPNLPVFPYSMNVVNISKGGPGIAETYTGNKVVKYYRGCIQIEGPLGIDNTGNNYSRESVFSYTDDSFSIGSDTVDNSCGAYLYNSNAPNRFWKFYLTRM